MELSFVFNALRRYWWVFVACTVAGAALGLMGSDRGAELYESTAVLLVSPPSESRVQVSFTNDPDRYVIGQLSVLRSDDLAERVANEVGDGATTGSVLLATSVEHEPQTDIVEIVVGTSDPDRSRQIADAYVEQYFEALQEQVSETRQPEIDALTAELESIREQVAAVDLQIEAAMATYLPDAPIGDSGFRPIPAIDQVAPDLVSTKQILLSEFEQVLATRTELTQLDINAKLRVTSEVVQRATLPTEPTPSTGRFYPLIGVIAGAFLGIVASVVLARLSRTALDVREIEETLGAEIIGEFPSVRALSRNRRVAVEALPHRLAGFVDAVAVRAESHAPVSGAFTVAVVGTERAAGTTTLAGALANRYAVNGSQVLLVDADARNSELTRLFAAGRPGIPGLLARMHEQHLPTRRPESHRADPLSPTLVSGLVVVGIGDKADAGGLRRQNVPDLIAATSAHGHVVVFDCGPVLDAASTLQIIQMVDVVVLAVPERRMLTRTLSTIANQLRARRGGLLPVLMPITRRHESVWRSRRAEHPSQGGPVALVSPPDVRQSGDDTRRA